MSVRCPCGQSGYESVFIYTAPPKGETIFLFSSQGYDRKILRCQHCGHFISVQDMNRDELYSENYINAKYAEQGLEESFRRIISLPPNQSDNTLRVQRVLDFSRGYFLASPLEKPLTVLDIGSGLGIFLYRMKSAGWDCTALDPDIRAVEHAKKIIGIQAIHADFLTINDGLGQYDLLAFNKVLEHVADPIAMLKKAVNHVHSTGWVYVEVPDGEQAVWDGPEREEFFIEHHHIYSFTSLAMTCRLSGFTVKSIERVREPSNKYTLRAFLTPMRSCR
ncbi:MAG: class I SAM-dependent methyltransferase [Candidatus Omnitrophica bacterium]|nr:class I SAM-dependent methyltransferase [Candidatus Omnitrophota bacterium]